MDTHRQSSRLAYQLERLYWKATSHTANPQEWQNEFSGLERQIRQSLTEQERSKLLRMSRSYQRLLKIAA